MQLLLAAGSEAAERVIEAGPHPPRVLLLVVGCRGVRVRAIGVRGEAGGGVGKEGVEGEWSVP